MVDYIFWFNWKIVILFSIVLLLGTTITLFVGAWVTAADKNSSLFTRFVLSAFLFVFGFLCLSFTAFLYDDIGTSTWKRFIETPWEYKTRLERDEEAKESKRKIYTSEDIERFVLVSYSPPKHVYVTLKHLPSGQVYERLYVSKHCSGKFDIGEEYNLPIREYHLKGNPSETFIEFVNLSGNFCTGN